MARRAGCRTAAASTIGDRGMRADVLYVQPLTRKKLAGTTTLGGTVVARRAASSASCWSTRKRWTASSSKSCRSRRRYDPSRARASIQYLCRQGTILYSASMVGL